MLVIAGISRPSPRVFAGKQAGSTTRDSSLSQERRDPASSLQWHPKGLAYVPVLMIVGPRFLTPKGGVMGSLSKATFIKHGTPLLIMASLAAVIGPFRMSRIRQAVDPVSMPDLEPFPLSLIPRTLDLGVLPLGRTARGEFRLANRLDESIAILRVETSCECVTVNPDSFRIDPRGEIPLRIAFDPSGEPNFRGKLRVEVIGYGPSDQIVFRTSVRVEIKGGNASSSSNPSPVATER